MNFLFLTALLAFVGWQVLAIRKDMSSRNFSTTLFLSLESVEKTESGLPLKSFHLQKRTKIPFAVVPGMELSDLGLSPTMQVSRVVFEDSQENTRVVHLKPRQLQLSELENIANSYLKHEWQIWN